MNNIVRNMLSEDQMIKLSLEERLAAAHAINDQALKDYGLTNAKRITYNFWDNYKDDYGRLMAVPSVDAMFRETHPELLQLRISRCENNQLQFEADLTCICSHFDQDMIGFVPLAIGLNEVRNLICDPNLITRIVALTEFWPASLINYNHEIEEDHIEKYGASEDDVIPF